MARILNNKGFSISLFPSLIPGFISKVINRLHDAGFEAYIVGGAIRDAMLGFPVKDWDISTSALPYEVRALFHDIRYFSLKHETVTLVDKGKLHDITTFRGEGSLVHSINEDLCHRDFTINAMAYDTVRNKILDPAGGQGDIQEKKIRAVGNPIDRFSEDPLRLLRGIRIHTETGFTIEGHTFECLKNMSYQLNDVANERIRDEFMKILTSPRPGEGFSLMRRSGILEILIPELLEGYRMKQNSRHQYTVYRHTMETINNINPDPLLRLAALFHDIAKPRVREIKGNEVHFFQHAEIGAELAGSIMERLMISKSTIKAVTHLIKFHMINFRPEWSDGAVRRLIRRVGNEHIENLLLLRSADLRAHGMVGQNDEQLSMLKKRIKEIQKGPKINNFSDLALGGREIMEILGLLPGPQVGNALKILMEKVEENPELNTKNNLKMILKKARL